MSQKLSSLDIIKLASICTVIGLFVMIFQAVYPVWHDNQPPKVVPPVPPGPDKMLAAVLDKDYHNYQEELKRGSSLPFFRTYAPARYNAWLKEAENGNAIAELFVGRCCEEGIVVARDDALGLKWVTSSAAHGNTFAMANLGWVHDTGRGVPKDHAEAMKWYRQAADQGNALGMLALGRAYDNEESYQQAKEWYDKAAAAGNAEAMRRIGLLYAYGQGVPKDAAKALEWYRKAAAAGDSNAAGLVMAERVGPSFKSYVDKDAGESVKAAALTTVRGTVPEFKALDLTAADAVLQNADIKVAVDKLHKEEPTSALLTAYNEMVEHYISLYQQSSLDTRTTFAGSFAGFTADWIDQRFTDGKYDDICTFWKKNYQELPVATLTEGEKDSFIRQLDHCVTALFKSGDRKEGEQLVKDALALCDGILAECPWDWYAKNAYMHLCFNAAASLSELGDTAIPTQPLLRRAWSVMLKEYGKEDILDRCSVLPLKGQVPGGASAEDVQFFERFAPGTPAKESGMKQFTISVEYNDTKYPFYVFVITGRNGYEELQDQFRWVKERRGLTVPADVRGSFSRLNKIAVENKVDFMALCVYALGTVDKK